MKKFIVNHVRAVVALLLVATATVQMTGCGGAAPCQGSECNGSSVGSGNFTAGPFPHSAATLDGPRCYMSGVVLGLFVDQVFTDPDPPNVVRGSDPLRVYWSVCNSGLTDSMGQSEAYTLSYTLRDPPSTPVDTDTYNLPPIPHCTCDVQSRVFQNELTPGSYTFALTGAVTGSVDRNITP